MSKIQILFKSGQILNLEVDNMKVVATGQQIVKLEWDNAVPKILFISVPEIEAILELPPPALEEGYG